MQELPTLHIIGYVLSFLGQLLVLVACLLLFIKQQSIATGLMLLGMVLSVIFSVVSLFMMSFFARGGDPESLLQTQGVFSILNTGSYVLFGLGLLLLVVKMAYGKK